MTTRTTVVTGAAAGLGHATARRLLADGLLAQDTRIITLSSDVVTRGRLDADDPDADTTRSSRRMRAPLVRPA